MKQIGDRLREIIEQKGLTPYRVSKKTGVSQSTLSRILNKNAIPNESNMKVLVDFFQVSENWLLTGEMDDFHNSNDDIKNKLIESLELNVKSLKKEIEFLKNKNAELKKVLESENSH